LKYDKSTIKTKPPYGDESLLSFGMSRRREKLKKDAENIVHLSVENDLFKGGSSKMRGHRVHKSIAFGKSNPMTGPFNFMKEYSNKI